jgi:hypothetical protein
LSLLAIGTLSYTVDVSTLQVKFQISNSIYYHIIFLLDRGTFVRRYRIAQVQHKRESSAVRMAYITQLRIVSTEGLQNVTYKACMMPNDLQQMSPQQITAD